MKKFLVLVFILFLNIIPSQARVHVAFTIDNNYPVYALLAINSILENSSSIYTFWIVENNVSDKNKKMMKDFIENRRQIVNFVHIDTDMIDNGTNLFTFSEKRITPIAIARIMLPELLPSEVHKVLYLDGDILVTDDLADLYSTQLGNYFAGMVDNVTVLEYTEHKFKKYYNSGVILMDLDKWRKYKISKKMVNYLHDNLEKFAYKKEKDNGKYKPFLFPDQDLINLVLEGKIKSLPLKWNNQIINSKVALSKGGIYHYLGPDKPWTYPYHNIMPYYIYYAYWEASPLKKYKYVAFFKSIKFRAKIMLRIKKERYKYFLDTI